ncbi:hypothetical protein WA026_022894 [Henosepilachna vigintioctopunctata]|uniref:Uncharacterized protein n=1 Tax=Henosepilachna vigintioctopunctata TaxID=420089 RepID=A0AAW1TZE0_9CUCU
MGRMLSGINTILEAVERQFSSFTVFKMKCLMLSFAFLAIASAAVLDYNRYGLMNKHEVGPIQGQYTGIYGQYPTWSQLWTKNFWHQKYGKGVYNKPEVYGDNAVFDRDAVYEHQAFYGQNVHEILTQILFRIFNKQVLMNLYSEYQQNWNQNVWEVILNHEEIFDKEVLVELIRQPFLRNILVQEGIFDKYVLQQIMSYYNVHQTYDQVLFEELVNKVALKNWLFKLGFYDKYFVYQFFNRATYGSPSNSMEYGQEYLIKVVRNPELRSFLVEQGVFNENILKQFLHHLETQGVYDEQLLRQLINKQFLRNFFVQQGYDYHFLNQVVADEIYGLHIFLKMHNYHQVPEYYYRQVGDMSYYPEHIFESVHQFPYGAKSVGYEMEKNIVKPYNKMGRDAFFQTEKYQKSPFFWNRFASYKTNYFPRFAFDKQGQTFSGVFDRFQGRQ